MEVIGNATVTDVLKLIEDFKSSLNLCKAENDRLLDQVRSLKTLQSDCQSLSCSKSCASGDGSDVSQKTVPGKSKKIALHHKLTPKEQLCMLINNATAENLRLRESNVKLKQESKIQDQKIRDLKHKLVIQERNIHKNLSQKLIIEDLKTVLNKKISEINQLKNNLNNLQITLNKERNKAKVIKTRQSSELSKPKLDGEILKIILHIEALLLKLDETIDGEMDNNCYINETCLEQSEKLMTRLKTINSKLIKHRELCKYRNTSGSVTSIKSNDVKRKKIQGKKKNSLSDKSLKVSSSPNMNIVNSENVKEIGDENFKQKSCLKSSTIYMNYIVDMKPRRRNSV